MDSCSEVNAAEASLGEDPSLGGSLVACWGRVLCWDEGTVVCCAGGDCECWETDTPGEDAAGSGGVEAG